VTFLDWLEESGVETFDRLGNHRLQIAKLAKSHVMTQSLLIVIIIN